MPHESVDKSAGNKRSKGFSPEDELPITVPIPGLPTRPAVTKEMTIRVKPLSEQIPGECDDVLTPAVRVPVRLLSSGVLANTTTSDARLLVSPSHRITTKSRTNLPNDSRPVLRVVRGLRVNVEFALHEGANYLGRSDDESVEINLEEQEPADRIWISRKHAVIHFHNGQLTLEDLSSLNGTFVNRNRVAPGEPYTLQSNDVIQVGTIQLRVII